MMPGDSVKIALSIMFANPDSVIGIQELTTAKPDFTKLVNLTKYTQNFFYNNMILSVNDNVNKSDNIVLYPNPAADEVYVSSNNLSLIREIDLYNILGEKVLERNNLFSSQYSFNTGSLQNGSYFLRIKSENNIETKLLQIAR
jgi:hypothetical protein